MQIRKNRTSHSGSAIATAAAIARRRWWLVAVPGIVAALLAYGFSRLIPNRYTSQTVVLVDHQKVPDSFVKPVINEDLNQRLSTMQEQILSRTRLQGLIERFGMFQKERGKVAMEDLVAMLRKQISVAPVRGEYSIRTGGLPGFTISVTASDPHLAQDLCSEITSIFMSENLRLRGELAQSTTDFLKSQLDNAKHDLDQQDSRLADFKRKYIGQLPGTEQTNMNMVASLTAQLETSNQALSKVQQDKAYFESLLADHLAALRESHSAAGAPASSPVALQQQLTVLNQQLAALEGRYTDNFPDVIKTKQQIAQIQKQLQNQPAATSTAADSQPATPEPPEIRQLRAQIRQLDAMAVERTQQQQRIQRDLSEYQGRLRLSPMVEEEFKKLTRDYQTALGFYNDLLAKYSQSEMATNLERRQEGEQFRVMDPPSLPEKPAYPNRPLFAGGGLFLGLFLGGGLAYLLEASDDTIRGEREVESRLELPVLILLPEVQVAALQGGRITPVRAGHFGERVSHV
jgi:polysaccharide chain length determinant protein (PEP-CTERM system associated)